MDLLHSINALNFSGTVEDVLGRLTDEMLEQFKEDFNNQNVKTYALLAIRLEASRTGVLDTNLADIKRLIQRAIMLVNLEAMRREGLIEIVPGFPPTLRSEQPFEMKTTEKGKKRFNELTMKAASEK